MIPKTADIRVDRLALEGDGIGRLDQGPLKGQAAFVPYSLPDEIVSAQLLTQKKNHSRWLPDKIKKSSPDRVVPACPYHFRPGIKTKWCGGCDWQHLSLPAQLKNKRQLVKETLERLGGFMGISVDEPLASPEGWRYRNKVQVPFGQRGNDIVAGFYAPGSHDVVDIKDCLIQSPASVELVQFVKEFARRNRWHPYNEDRHQGWIRHLLVRTNKKGEALVALVTQSPVFRDRNEFVQVLRQKFPFVIGIHQNIQPARSNVILGRDWISLWGQSKITEEMAGLKLSYSAGSFFQVNSGAAEQLYLKAIHELKIKKDSTVLDLYCGVGAMTLLAAKEARFAVGVEPVPLAIKNARENALVNNVKNIQFSEEESESFLNSRQSLHREFLDSSSLLVIVDPPRSGCTPQVLQGLLSLKPARIVYVSCHPATLARDLKLLSTHYQPQSVAPVDLFPQTSHIETVVRLEKIHG